MLLLKKIFLYLLIFILFSCDPLTEIRVNDNSNETPNLIRFTSTDIEKIEFNILNSETREPEALVNNKNSRIFSVIENNAVVGYLIQPIYENTFDTKIDTFLLQLKTLTLKRSARPTNPNIGEGYIFEDLNINLGQPTGETNEAIESSMIPNELQIQENIGSTKLISYETSNIYGKTTFEIKADNQITITEYTLYLANPITPPLQSVTIPYEYNNFFSDSTLGSTNSHLKDTITLSPSIYPNNPKIIQEYDIELNINKVTTKQNDDSQPVDSNSIEIVQKNQDNSIEITTADSHYEIYTEIQYTATKKEEFIYPITKDNEKKRTHILSITIRKYNDNYYAIIENKSNPQTVNKIKIYDISLYLDPSVTQISTDTFKGYKFTRVVLPKGLTKIGDSAFENNNIYAIRTTDTANTINEISLRNYTKSTTEAVKSINTLPQTLLTLGESSFKNNKLFTISIPQSIEIIENNVFQLNSLQTLTFNSESTNQNKIIAIGAYAFADNQLSSISIPTDSIINSNVSNFESDGVYLLAQGIFENNKLTSIPNNLIKSNITTLGTNLFKDNLITTVELPNTITHIYVGAFFNNPIKTLTLPSSIVSIAPAAFNYNSDSDEIKEASDLLSEITLDDNTIYYLDRNYQKYEDNDMNQQKQLKLLPYGSFHTSVEITGGTTPDR